MKHRALKGSFCPTYMAECLAQHLASTVHCLLPQRAGRLPGGYQAHLVSHSPPFPWQELHSHVLNVQYVMDLKNPHRQAGG